MASLNPIGREKRKIDCSRVGLAIHEPVAVVPAALSIKNSPGEMFKPTSSFRDSRKTGGTSSGLIAYSRDGIHPHHIGNAAEIAVHGV